MSAEEWRQSMVPNYEVSSFGRVRRSAPGRKTYAGRVMSPVALKIGYLAVAPVLCAKLAAKHGISIATAFNVATRKYWSHIE